MLRYWTAGESHGKGLVALVDGFPAGLEIDTDLIDRELARRQGGYGRGGRQRIEADRVEILSGVWQGRTLGSPIALMVVNEDSKLDRMEDLERPRPGHGDLAGVKYLGSIRPFLNGPARAAPSRRRRAGTADPPFRHRAFAYVVEIGPMRISLKPGTLVEQKACATQAVYSLDPEQDGPPSS